MLIDAEKLLRQCSSLPRNVYSARMENKKIYLKKWMNLQLGSVLNIWKLLWKFIKYLNKDMKKYVNIASLFKK